MLELSGGSGAAGRVLADAHRAVVFLVNLAHLALLAVVVQAGVCREPTEQRSISTALLLSHLAQVDSTHQE